LIEQLNNICTTKLEHSTANGIRFVKEAMQSTYVLFFPCTIARTGSSMVKRTVTHKST